jgi:hypothetical protein
MANEPLVDTKPTLVSVKEQLTDDDKAQLDLSKMNRELALSQANLHVAKGQLADAQHNILVLQLALKYNLAIGDGINDDGTINRKGKDK